MRILYFYQYFTTPKGAYSTRAFEFARRWIQQGHSVTVITSAYDQSDLQPLGLVRKLDIEGIDVRLMNLSLSTKHGFLRRLLSFGLYSAMSVGYALFARADVVLCSSGPITVGLPGLMGRWLRRRPFVFEVRDLWPDGAIELGVLTSKPLIWIAQNLERLCYKYASAVVALSPGMASGIEPKCPSSITVIPNAADIELAQQTQDGPMPADLGLSNQHIFLYAGAIGLINDCQQLVDLAAELHARDRNDVHIVVIGDGNERAEVENNAHSLGLTNIEFRGLQPKEDVFRWLHRATASLFTVKDVSFLGTASPNKVFDSLATGTPVIQTSQGWIKALLDREQCGITVSHDSPEDFADAVLSIVDDTGRQQKMSKNARRTALAQFERSDLARKMLCVLTGASQGKGVA